MERVSCIFKKRIKKGWLKMSIVIRTNKTEDVILINKKITELGLEVDAKRGRYNVDANSIMGLLSLDFSQGVELVIHETNKKSSIDELINFLQKYI
jgi:phosphotransferase system HPr-like phosphotransfer protein